MAITTDDVKAYVGASDSEHDALIADCLLEAQALVAKYVGVAAVPAPILDRAHLEVAADLFNRRNAPNGIVNQQFAMADGGVGGQAVRVTRDPMKAAYGLLGRWVLPW